MRGLGTSCANVRVRVYFCEHVYVFFTCSDHLFLNYVRLEYLQSPCVNLLCVCMYLKVFVCICVCLHVYL